MNIPAWFEAWWQTLTPIEIALCAIVAVVVACIASLFIEAKRMEEYERAALARQIDRLVADQVDRATEYAAQAHARAEADLDSARAIPVIERRPMWSEIGR